jgi:hypothetical protein
VLHATDAIYHATAVIYAIYIYILALIPANLKTPPVGHKTIVHGLCVYRPRMRMVKILIRDVSVSTFDGSIIP